MKVVIGNTEYTKIKNLKFGDSVDVLCEELPVNDFSVEIQTADTVPVGAFAKLYDDDGSIWANFWIISNDKYTEDTVTIYCQSIVAVLERQTVSAVMYDNADFTTTVTALFALFGITVNIDTAFATATLSGYAPEQTVRDRLQWICFVSGAYIQTTFVDTVAVKSISASVGGVVLPQSIYQFPTVSYADYVTAIKVTYYTYVDDIPTIDQNYVKVWDDAFDYYHMYIQTEQSVTISDPNVPSTVKPNIIEIKDINLINSTNVNDIVNRLANYHFNRMSMTVDLVNNGEYKSGERYVFDLNNGNVFTGIISQNEWSFGNSHKSSAEVHHGEMAEAVNLIINAIWEDEQALLKTYTYHLPSGFAFSIPNPVLDLMTPVGGGYARDIYCPVNVNAVGTMGSTETVKDENYYKALTYEQRYLYIYSVDSVEFEEETAVIDGE